MGVGALIFGMLGQRGRKTFYGLDMLVMAIAAIAQMFVPGIWWLVAVRFVLGLGIGGDYVLSPTIMSEHANQKDRGKLLALGFATMSQLGPIVAALLALLLLSGLHVSHDLTWRIVLGAGAIPALSVLYLRRRMPETARYLARLADNREGAAEVVKSVNGAADAGAARARSASVRRGAAPACATFSGRRAAVDALRSGRLFDLVVRTVVDRVQARARAGDVRARS